MKVAAVVADKGAEFSPIYRADFEEAIARLSELGYDGVEISFLNPFDVEYNKIRQILEEYALEPVALSTGLTYVNYGISLSDRDESRRKKAIERFMGYIDVAEAIGSDIVVLGLIRGKNRNNFELFKKSLKECLKYAEKKKVTIALEPINRYETEMINKVEEAASLMEEMESEHLKIMADTFHMNIEERSIEETIRIFGKNFVHFHIADSNRYAPGYGHIDFRVVIGALRETGYDRALSAEILADDVENSLKQTIKHIRLILYG